MFPATLGEVFEPSTIIEILTLTQTLSRTSSVASALNLTVGKVMGVDCNIRISQRIIAVSSSIINISYYCISFIISYLINNLFNIPRYYTNDCITKICSKIICSKYFLNKNADRHLIYLPALI